MSCEVYLFDVSRLEATPEHLARLSQERQQKVLAFRNEAARRLSLGAGLLLDYALRQHGMCEREMQYTYGTHGKPHLTPHTSHLTPQLHFNLSHSGTMAACAIASCPVGIDIERTTRSVSEALLRRVCSTAEIEAVRRDPLTFFDFWTAKEARLKMTGEGINGDLTALPLSGIITRRLPNGYTLSICTQEPCPQLKITEVQEL